MLTARLLLAALLALYSHGPVALHLHDRIGTTTTASHPSTARHRRPPPPVTTAARCNAPPMEAILGEMIEAAEAHHVPVQSLAAVCLMESGLNPCGVSFCGTGRISTAWACAHGAQCEGNHPAGSRAELLRNHLRAAAFLLARQATFAPGAHGLHLAEVPYPGIWTYAVQGYHLGGAPQRLYPCPAWHNHGDYHFGVYALIVLGQTQRLERKLVENGGLAPDAQLPDDEAALWHGEVLASLHGTRRPPRAHLDPGE